LPPNRFPTAANRQALEAKLCYGTSSLEHPGVQMISMERGRYYLGGRVWGLELPKRCATGTVKRVKIIHVHARCSYGTARVKGSVRRSAEGGALGAAKAAVCAGAAQAECSNSTISWVAASR
jgi:hypothetical protein